MRIRHRCLLSALAVACLAGGRPAAAAVVPAGASAGDAGGQRAVGALEAPVADGPRPEATAVDVWRAQRRAALRAKSLAYAAAARGAQDPAAAARTIVDPAVPAPRFGLLVIPVDFADERLPADWDATGLAPRLSAPDGQSLRRYFTVASAGRCELVPVLAPLVRLAGDAGDYSDVGLNGFTRTRRLAAEALAAVAAAGFDFRLADLDGPDGRPGSGDDDGWVDGVLVLHAEIGQENDPVAGRVQALQYFLAEPVVAGGVRAGPYAVASLRSGPGIWAHETGHLLGLEDRYDPLLPPRAGAAGDLAGGGGLGVFSLMAAGALGTGGGWNPSLPDAYSRALLGWCDVVEGGELVGDRAPGEVAGSLVAAASSFALGAAPGSPALRVWTEGDAGPEFFLQELRGGAAVAPFDAAVPGHGVVVQHVDESVAEGSWRDDGGGRWHLRAGLVEADGDEGLHEGDDAGVAGDLFAVDGASAVLSPTSLPSSDGYGGPTGVTVAWTWGSPPDHVDCEVQLAPGPWVRFRLAFGAGAERPLLLTATVAGGTTAALAARLEAVGDDGWGAFAGGGRALDLELAADGDGTWRPATAVAWIPAAALPDSAVTSFLCTFTGPGLTPQAVTRTWCWGDARNLLDFAADWPGAWATDQPDGPGTAWRRWNGAATPAGGGRPVLACTGETADPAAWPDALYTNNGRARLTSLPLEVAGGGVRLVHWVDVETLADGTPMDGATASWVAADGSETPAIPVGGWPARVDGGSGSALHGRGAFGGAPGELDAFGRPVWRCDVLPGPAGPGPWRLRLEFAANALWRARGWLLAECAFLPEPSAADAGRLRWDSAQGLAWDWPWRAVEEPPTFRVQARTLPDSTWTHLGDIVGTSAPAAWVRARLQGPADARQEVRVCGTSPWGTLALGPVALTTDGGPGDGPLLGAPWPNPAAGSLRLALAVPDGTRAAVRVYDLGGRLVRAFEVPAGRYFVEWDGRDDAGRRLPAGAYILRLEGVGRALERKVVLVH